MPISVTKCLGIARPIENTLPDFQNNLFDPSFHLKTELLVKSWVPEKIRAETKVFQ